MCGAYLGRSCAHRDHQKQDPPNRERGGRVRLGLRVAIARDADAAPACRCPNTALPPLGNSNTDLVPHPPRHTPAALLDRGGRRMARGVRPASENIGPSWNPRPPRRQIASHHRFKLQAVERHSGNCPTLHCPHIVPHCQGALAFIDFILLSQNSPKATAEISKSRKCRHANGWSKLACLN